MATLATEQQELDAVAGASPNSEAAEHQTAPVEMNDLSTHAAAATDSTTAPAETTSDTTKPTTQAAPSTTATTTEHSALNRTETVEALGPDGGALPESSPSATTNPGLRITLMLTTGSRHPYNITEKYLRSRKVEALDADGNFEPRELSGYKLKELIWTDWRPEWDPRPRDPSSIRLILMGRMLDDKVALRELPFSLTNPNVVHMTVKPADLIDDDAEGAGKGTGKSSIRGHNNAEESGAGCCRCVIQ